MTLDSKVQTKLDEILTNDCYKGYELQLDKICKKLDLSTFSAAFTDPKLSGAIYQDKETNSFKIFVNENHAMTRIRFTIAHEIGHYISALCGSFSEEQLFRSGNGFEDYGISFRKEGVLSLAETEANTIAAEMLMPANMIKMFADQGLSVEQIADKFFVSQHAVSIRLDRLGLFLL